MLADRQEASAHTQAQHTLIKIGRALRYDVFVARNDQHKNYHGDDFSQLTLARLPALGLPPEVLDTVELIDVSWLKQRQPDIVCAFEIEQRTSIYSGILRMQDLARSLPQHDSPFYLVAPEAREREVLAQMTRPALYEAQQQVRLGYLPAEARKNSSNTAMRCASSGRTTRCCSRLRARADSQLLWSSNALPQRR